MIICITTAGESEGSPLDSRFGRAPRFMVHDTKTGSWKAVDNTQNRDAVQGAGIQAALNAVKTGASVVISGHCGPKAFKVLTAEGIEIHYAENMSVKEAVETFLAGKLKKATAADVEGHWV
jgi:predicted Fe-Mo cluster-binding NifX family protein